MLADEPAVHFIQTNHLADSAVIRAVVVGGAAGERSRLLQ